MSFKFFKLLGRVFFVLIFITTGYEKLSQPTKFLPILSDRYSKFEKFLLEKGHSLPKQLTFAEIKPQLPLINQIIAYEMIFFGVGVICFIPYMSLGLALHLIVFTLVMNNPLYHKFESKDFYHECGQVILSLGALGISIMFLGEGESNESEVVKRLGKVDEAEEGLEESGEEKRKKEGKEGKSHKKKNKRE